MSIYSSLTRKKDFIEEKSIRYIMDTFFFILLCNNLHFMKKLHFSLTCVFMFVTI